VDHQRPRSVSAATPRYGLGAREHNSLARCLLDETREILRKFRSLHVVGEAAKESIPPAHIREPPMSGTKASKTSTVCVANVGDFQRGWERVTVDL